MSLINYWPSKDHIVQCIRTEAEELAEHTLLAVHEPMQLLRRGASASDEKYCSEKELLEHFLEVERPIPIIGRSGVGKSHLIRWLNAQLKLRKEACDWHIVRIPKNASLRQVLELLLKDLDGEDFEQARSQIKTVGTKLDTHNVAELLLTFMGQQLRRLHNEVSAEIHNYQVTNTRPDAAEEQRLKEIDKHVKDGLPDLINDPDYKRNLLRTDHCIYQFAQRLTKGASDDELSENDYQIYAKDLDFNYNVSNLSLSAREYVRKARLNTYEPAREEAARVLNEVLGEATREAFQRLFHFNQGSFQDLFKAIRQTLYSQGRTLVVLVEDMAAISAIEDVLIDSLLEEGVREGEQKLCPLRSAIAVTDGYAGYTRRQGTIKTRARYEWWIHEQIGEEEHTLARIIDFCSRYINAARHGGQGLHELWLERDNQPWPPIWHDEDADRQYLDAFGKASTGVPLYPFNSSAISAFADKFCRDQANRLQFNPRVVLNEILLAVLRDYREDCEQNRFPPAGFVDIQARGELRRYVRTLGLNEPGRAESLVAIWGYGARNFEELRNILSADIALTFGMTVLANNLQSGVIESRQPDQQQQSISKSQSSGTSRSPVDPEAVALEQIERTVDLWFQRTQELGQNEARILRNALEDMYQRYAQYEWMGLSESPPLKTGRLVNIYLPNAMANPPTRDISFCTDEKFVDPETSVLLQTTAMALLRYAHYNRRENIGWQYPQGFDDYTHYQNFAARWVPVVLQTLTEQVREKLNEQISEHIQAAWSLGLLRDSDTHKDRINRLLAQSDAVRNSLQPAVCESLLNLRNEQLSQWDALRGRWLKLVASNDHGMEGDLVTTALKPALEQLPNRKLQQAKEAAYRELQSTLQHIQLLVDCENVEDFNKTIDDLIELIRQMQKQGEYPQNIEGLPVSRTLIEKLKRVAEPGSWSSVKAITAAFEGQDVIKQWQLLNQVDGSRIKIIKEVLESWRTVYNRTLPKLQNQNATWGAEKLASAKESVTQLLTDITANVAVLMESSDEHA